MATGESVIRLRSHTVPGSSTSNVYSYGKTNAILILEIFMYLYKWRMRTIGCQWRFTLRCARWWMKIYISEMGQQAMHLANARMSG